MDKKLFRSLMLLITFSVFLVLVIVRFDDVLGLCSTVAVLLSPLYIGLALAFVLSGPCNFFQRKLDVALNPRAKALGLPLAVLLSYLLLFGVIAALVSFVLPQLALNIQTFTANLNGYIAQTQALINDWMAFFNWSSLDLSQLDDRIQDLLSGVAGALSSALSTAFPQLISFTGAVVSVVITALLSLVFSVYILAGRKTLLSQCRRVFQAYLPPATFDAVLHVARLTVGTFQKFVVGQIVEAFILGSLIVLGCTLLGLPYALLIGTLVGVTALVPIVGAYVGAVTSALLLAMVDPVQALWFIIMLVCVQQFEGNVIYPRVVGSSLGLPGIWVLAAVTIGGGLFGFPGMLLGVPVAAILYTLLRQDVHRRLGGDTN